MRSPLSCNSIKQWVVYDVGQQASPGQHRTDMTCHPARNTTCPTAFTVTPGNMREQAIHCYYASAYHLCISQHRKNNCLINWGLSNSVFYYSVFRASAHRSHQCFCSLTLNVALNSRVRIGCVLLSETWLLCPTISREDWVCPALLSNITNAKNSILLLELFAHWLNSSTRGNTGHISAAGRWDHPDSFLSWPTLFLQPLSDGLCEHTQRSTSWRKSRWLSCATLYTLLTANIPKSSWHLCKSLMTADTNQHKHLERLIPTRVIRPKVCSSQI